ncbi:hydroxyacylglutathione hydrolase [Marinobacterium weihaiense]|uniref:Hydroxyacylglutathione hydrolase n=1 Tax=Marinobacterium weihaiense TaxID=2851016 RepID=A0ABS6M8F3_9GAMM|nr:hydroxyacylglutathione hydrolase [Marinobacterium weihaiense]MBV0932179.1 hydroxyacylglutathione hydrolase [Marinobacterium weihaiense]
MFDVTPIPAFNDNYIWALTSARAPGETVVVDPGDAVPVLNWLQQQGLKLSAILITHHHHDHTGGADQLRKHGSAPVYGPVDSPFEGITNPLRDGDTLSILGHTLNIKAVPAHTRDHISYLQPEDTPQLFCGDTLFLAGCGRLFEGTARQMLDAMNYFSSLDDSTEVYCTHEYSLANLAFAASVEPGNADIRRVHEHCHRLRQQGHPTLPSSIQQERHINPFMRTAETAVAQAAEHFNGNPLESEVAVLAALREWKNRF